MSRRKRRLPKIDIDAETLDKIVLLVVSLQNRRRSQGRLRRETGSHSRPGRRRC